MKIGGLQPVTLLDYPQKVAAIIFAQGCNMRCPFCYNPNLVLPDLIDQEKPFSQEKVFELLRRRQKYLDGVCLTGGEPTLQLDLADFCRAIKNLGLLIKLDTNGLLPDVLRNLIDQQLVDYVAMDIKGPLHNLEKFCGLNVDPEKIKASIEIIKNSDLGYEFRSTLVKGLHTKEDVKKMAQEISGARTYFLQNFNPQDVLVGRDFKGESFTHKQMQEFCQLAGKYVEHCEVR